MSDNKEFQILLKKMYDQIPQYLVTKFVGSLEQELRLRSTLYKGQVMFEAAELNEILNTCFVNVLREYAIGDNDE